MKLEGLELRKPLAEAAGWSWQTHVNGIACQCAWDQNSSRMRLFTDWIDWNDVVAAWRAFHARKCAKGEHDVLMLHLDTTPEEVARAIVHLDGQNQPRKEPTHADSQPQGR